MLKDLAIEIAVSAGLGFCAFWFFPFLMRGLGTSSPIGEQVTFFSFIGLVVFLYFSARHLKSLSNRGKTKHATFFTVIIVVALLISFVMCWNFLQNMRA